MNPKADLSRARIKASMLADAVSRKTAETKGTLADAASKAAVAAADVASATANATGKAISQTASNAAEQLLATPAKAASAAQDGIRFIHDHAPSEQLRRARLEAFKHGMKQGAYLMVKQQFDYYCAYVTTMCFLLQCDGEYSSEEKAWLEAVIESQYREGLFDNRTAERLRRILADEPPTAEAVEAQLDKVSITSLERIGTSIQAAMEADGEIADEELQAQEHFAGYLKKRMEGDPEDKLRAERVIEESVSEYDGSLSRLDREFDEKTKLQGSDAAFLIGATMLQVVRVLVVNVLTKVECAGKNNIREKNLHEFQNKIFHEFDPGDDLQARRLYAPGKQILSTHGVPYDVTTYAGDNLGLFTGGNHRFATLGHDPVLGLLFGTANIMTNTITCVSEKYRDIPFRIPLTFCVEYGPLGTSPAISAPTSSIEMLSAAAQRIPKEPEIATAAFLKQIIHVGTDLHTPCGIQIPFANIIFDKSHVEALTRYVNTGALAKLGAQAGLAALINWLIATLHGSTLLFRDDGSPYATDLYQARTKKIILISNAIATSSSIVEAAITKNPRCLDLGGAAVLVHQLFESADFIAKLKREYVKNELDKIYDERAGEITQ